MIKQAIKRSLAANSYRLVRTDVAPSPSKDMKRDGNFAAIYDRCADYTMASPARVYSIYLAVRYLVQNRIPGDMAECGVWRGGSSMAAALALIDIGDTSRKLYLYDTFEGMPEPEAVDRRSDGRHADEILKGLGHQKMSEWCHASIDDVRRNMMSTGYPAENIVYVRGRVQDTIPREAPDRLAFLRLDTDWHASTAHELKHLFPLLEKRGVAMFDDYGSWEGHRTAIDEYFAERSVFPLFNRVDTWGRMMIKDFD
ncbi:MAG: TylF/MycF family methyltransferase [Caulobacterales bacterium]|nr:TylF/MycF family methyltransferase [Caulobacterales bacterium]